MTEPIWRNVLRIQDVPWLQHHSLGGGAVFPAAGDFSMAIEAITQLNDDSPNPIQINGYVLRDVSIKAALVTLDNDAGVEVIYSTRPSVSNETDTGQAWWDFTVSSVSETGQGTDHMAGCIAINTRQRGQAPKKVPNYRQCAGGKAWNQALREVGFDYGLTFQDMDDIRFDGKSYSAACKTVIKSTSGIMRGESRHVLHPGTVDSCLQLIIVSIYAGRLNDISCGAVPIEVDQVAIWVPTAEQFKNNTTDVFSWTDQRDIRSFVTGSQLIASDGELLMDISNMRCTTYEAALPQRTQDPLSSQPYGEMVWKYDIDSLNPSNDLGEMKVDQLLDLAVYKNPALKVIEIGTQYAATILSKWEWLDYTITEGSSQAAEDTSPSLQKWKNARLQILNISQRLDGQIDAEGLFDLVVAPIGIMTSGILENIRYILKPRGHAILETSGEVSTDMLQTCGFSDVTFRVQHTEKPAILLCTAAQPFTSGVVNGAQHQVQIIYRKDPLAMLAEVRKSFEQLGWQATSTSLEKYQSKAGEHVVMLADLEGPLLATLEEEELAAIQRITSAASMLLWVSFGGLLLGKMPEYAMVVGLARSITSEQSSLDFTVLDFDLENTPAESVTDIITATAQRQDARLESRESEYYVSKGLVYISRLVPNNNINNMYVFDKEETRSAHLDLDVPLVGKVQSGKIVFQANVVEEESLKSDHVEIKVSVAGINKESTLVINGHDYPTSFSHEIGGVIQRVGESVVGLKVGDRVFGFSFGNFATIQYTPADLDQKVEDGEALMEFASLPMAYGTALHGLKHLARLEAQENVLILNGTGSPGLAAIKVTQCMNAIPYVVVGTEAEATMLMKSFGLPRQQMLVVSGLSVIAQLKASTGGRGADVVFSSTSVNANVARECWRCIEPFGRFVDSGRKNVLKRSALDTIPLHRGASYHSFDIPDLYSRKPQVLRNVLCLATSLYRQRLITALSPITVDHLSEIDSAIALFSDDFAAGKTLISYEPSERPLNVLKSTPHLRFRADATYLLAGCLGGLGRSLTSWMMKKGARRFASLSRSGTDSEQAAILVNDIEAAGAAVQVIRGNVAVMADVERAVKGMPSEYSIRGVVQAAMDGLFQSMPYSNWINSTRPKVQGTMNLHKALDFFVMTSSVSDILGTPGQSNYAAGNSVLGYLARHRVPRGQKATSLILTMVLGVGYVAEHLELEQTIQSKGIYSIDENHLLASFETSIAIQQGNGSVDHIVLGMDPARLRKSVSDSAATDVFWIDNARFATLAQAISSAGISNSAGESGKTILAAVASAATPAEAVLLVSAYFVEKLSRLLLIDAGEFEPDGKAIADYGLDSMIGAELRNWIFKNLGLDIPFQQLLGPALTITKFAWLVCANQNVAVEG